MNKQIMNNHGNDDEYYRQKYLKYKVKYTTLKSQAGGVTLKSGHWVIVYRKKDEDSLSLPPPGTEYKSISEINKLLNLKGYKVKVGDNKALLIKTTQQEMYDTTESSRKKLAEQAKKAAKDFTSHAQTAASKLATDLSSHAKLEAAKIKSQISSASNQALAKASEHLQKKLSKNPFDKHALSAVPTSLSHPLLSHAPSVPAALHIGGGPLEQVVLTAPANPVYGNGVNGLNIANIIKEIANALKEDPANFAAFELEVSPLGKNKIVFK